MLRRVLALKAWPTPVARRVLLRPKARLASHILRLPRPHQHITGRIWRVPPLVSRVHLRTIAHLTGPHLRWHHVPVHAHVSHLGHGIHAVHSAIIHLAHSGHAVHAGVAPHAHAAHGRVMATLLAVTIHRTVLGVAHAHVVLHL